MAAEQEKQQTWMERLGHPADDPSGLILELAHSSTERKVEILAEKLADDLRSSTAHQAPVDPANPATGTGEVIGAAWLPTKTASTPRMDSAE